MFAQIVFRSYFSGKRILEKRKIAAAGKGNRLQDEWSEIFQRLSSIYTEVFIELLSYLGIEDYARRFTLFTW